MPEWNQEILRRLAPLKLAPTREAEIAEELSEHLEDRYLELLASGQPEDAALRTALGELEGEDLLARGLQPIERNYREPTTPGGGSSLVFHGIFQDLRYALRMLRNSPGFMAVAILTLALGIGANTAIFSVVEGVVLRPLPYPHSERIVHFGWLDQTLIPNLSVPELEFCRDHATSYSAIAGYQGYFDQQLDQGVAKRWIKTASVTDGFFESLGVTLELGRPFRREFTRPDGAYAAVLTDSLWRGAFAENPGVVGRQITLDGQSYTVTGVLPPDFQYTQPVDLFVSYHLGNSLGDQGRNTDVIGRLKPGVSFSRAQAEARLLGSGFLARATAAERQGLGVLHLDRYQDYLASDYRTVLLILLSAVGLLLLIACANVASLLLARATARQREVSIRLALGASRRRLLRQLLTEGLVLGIAGAAAGLTAAVASLHVFVSAIPWDLPSIDHIGLDGGVLLFTSGVAAAVSIVFGLASFFQTRSVDLHHALKDARASAGPRRIGVLNALVVGEIAISLTLALGAGLLIESLYHLYQEKLGFNSADLFLMHTPFGPNQSGASAWNFERQALARIEAIPGVASAAIVSVAPLHGQGNIPVQRDAQPQDSIGATEYRSISPNYFSTMKIPLLRGRLFDQKDFVSSAPVVVINETLARDWWPGENPIGDRIVLGEFQGHQYLPSAEPSRQVVGIVADVKGMLLNKPAPPMVYVPAPQGFTLNDSTDWVVRTSVSAGIASELRKAIAGVAPDQRITDLEPMTQLISGSVSQTNFEALLMGTFGALALTLTLVGVYGVLSFQVEQRAREIGLRMALGASRADVWRLIIGKAARVAALGVIIGLLAAFGLTRLMASLLYQVQPTDLRVFAAVGTVALLVAILAAYLPARRAMRVDAMAALRYE